MTVYVDKLREYRIRKWCHLIADTVDELETFARRMGLHPDWYQSKSFPHYDLTERRRIEAIKLGAKEITDTELVSIIRNRKE